MLCFPCFSVAEEWTRSDSIKFVQISDVHLHENSKNVRSRMYAYSQELFADAVKQINNIEDVDFVVFTGDMIGYPNESFIEKFIALADTINAPWFWTTGNHDVGGWGLSKSTFVELIDKNTQLKKKKPYYSFIIKDFVFLFMDGAIIKAGTANGFFPEEQLLWLEKQLKTNKDSYVIIFQHFPVVEPFRSKSHCVLNADQYLEILDKYNNVAGIFSGHYHAAKVKIRNNIAHISSPALVEYPNAFRIINVDRVDEYVFISLEFKPVNLKEVRRESFERSASAKLYVGSEEDRDSVIILHKPLNENELPSVWIK